MSKNTVVDNGWQIVAESDLRETKTGNDMVFGTALDKATMSTIPFVAFGNTARAVVGGKLRPHSPNFIEPKGGFDPTDPSQRAVLGVSIWQNSKGECELA